MTLLFLICLFGHAFQEQIPPSNPVSTAMLRFLFFSKKSIIIIHNDQTTLKPYPHLTLSIPSHLSHIPLEAVAHKGDEPTRPLVEGGSGGCGEARRDWTRSNACAAMAALEKGAAATARCGGSAMRRRSNCGIAWAMAVCRRWIRRRLEVRATNTALPRHAGCGFRGGGSATAAWRWS